MKKFLIPFILILISVSFFYPFFLQGKLPIPSDNIIGLFHPFRDLYAPEYPNGIPFKNSLITDPVQQQYPWRWLAVEVEKTMQLPLWNPYSFSGTPLLAILQGGVLYPLNILLFLLPFAIGWSVLISLQPVLASMFTYLYLRNLRLKKEAALLGGIAFAFSGFMVAWMEWGTVGHVALWLPLILLAIDKLTLQSRMKEVSKVYLPLFIQKIVVSRSFLWGFVYLFAISSSLFAGHLQTFFYLSVFSTIYFFTRWFQYGRKASVLFLYLILSIAFLLLTLIQWLPTAQFIELSARVSDQANWQKEGWFLPWQHVVQFIAPDFFGNPTTLNYWGVWNYGEFIGYIGIAPLFFAFTAFLYRRDKKTLFFGFLFLLSLPFALPTFFARLPFLLQIPFLSTAQPTRLLFITDFSLSILAALGFDYLLRKKLLPVKTILLFFLMVVALWGVIIFGQNTFALQETDIAVAKKNIFLPTLLLITTCFLSLLFRIQNNLVRKICIVLFLGLAIVDLFRFGYKFLPFTPQQYLFPQTSTIDFLQKQSGNYRIMITDRRILHPNFSVRYKLQAVEGYDPLYLQRYGEFIAAVNRKEQTITPPFGFNRIVTLQDPVSPFVNLLGVKYVLSFSEIENAQFKQVHKEGQTIVYENKSVFPRVFFVEQVIPAQSKQDAIEKLYNQKDHLQTVAIVEDNALTQKSFSSGSAEIVSYTENAVEIETRNTGEGFLVFTDINYPTWRVTIDGRVTTIYTTDYLFRGVIVPKGMHRIKFSVSLF